MPTLDDDALHEFANVVSRIPGWPAMSELDDLEEIDLRGDLVRPKRVSGKNRIGLEAMRIRGLHSIKARSARGALRSTRPITLPKLSCLNEDDT